MFKHSKWEIFYLSLTLDGSFNLANDKNLSFIQFSGLHSLKFNCGDVLGVILAQQRGGPRQGGAGSDHCAHHDHPHQLCQRRPAQDLLHEVHRHLPLCLFLHGVWGHGGVRLCGIHRQEDPAEEEQVRGLEEVDGGEEAGDGKTDGAAVSGDP